MENKLTLSRIAHTFQRVLSGHPTAGDLDLCRSLEPLQSVVHTALIPGESEAQCFDRLVLQLQGTQSLRALARAGGEHFDARGHCRSPDRARAFINAAQSAISFLRLAPKSLMCGYARVTENEWNDLTFQHHPNFGAWTLQLVSKGKLELIWEGTTELCNVGDIIIVPPQASTLHRKARDVVYLEEYWFHFPGTSRLLQWLDWIPRLSKPEILRGIGEDEDFTNLATGIVALNGGADDLQYQLQQVMFEQLLIRQRIRLGQQDVGRRSDHADLAKHFIMEQIFEPLSLEDIARHCGISCSHLSEVFKAETGVTPMRWRERERLNKAGELLKSSKLRVTEVASLTGYGDYHHFAKRFKAVTGLTPSAFRNS